jgi:hypothetical protein
MSKRFTSTEKWSDAWFVDLSVEGKLLFLFLCDMCNIAGFYERSDKMMRFYLGWTPEELDIVTKEISKSVVYREKVYFLKNFLDHQKNLPLNPNNNCHKSIIYWLKKRVDLFGDVYPDEIRGCLGAVQGLGSPIGKGKGNSNVTTTPESSNQVINICGDCRLFKTAGCAMWNYTPKLCLAENPGCKEFLK